MPLAAAEAMARGLLDFIINSARNGILQTKQSLDIELARTLPPEAAPPSLRRSAPIVPLRVGGVFFI